MKNQAINCLGGRIGSALALASVLVLSACHSNDSKRAEQMTSFSQGASASTTPQLFTIPQDQMAHVQLVTVEPATLKQTLRLTGAVEYNAFNTTPVITQVGGPVSRILVEPGDQPIDGLQARRMGWLRVSNLSMALDTTPTTCIASALSNLKTRAPPAASGA